MPKVDVLEGPSLVLSDAKEQSQILLNARPGTPSLDLYDSEGCRAAVGGADLKTLSTGEIHKTSAASITMFDKEGKIIWRAP